MSRHLGLFAQHGYSCVIVTNSFIWNSGTLQLLILKNLLITQAIATPIRHLRGYFVLSEWRAIVSTQSVMWRAVFCSSANIALGITSSPCLVGILVLDVCPARVCIVYVVLVTCFNPLHAMAWSVMGTVAIWYIFCNRKSLDPQAHQPLLRTKFEIVYGTHWN